MEHEVKFAKCSCYCRLISLNHKKPHCGSGELSFLRLERAAMRLAAEAELDNRVLLRSRVTTRLKLRSYGNVLACCDW
ncbi:hypothetical protein A2U01_0051224 [Trifolium medium]|uniref:Uncharacterized protein n=1 Tax=Trifolium medium TaxID=97028 RepID=A0A392R382_9FABA|nr:hypothetical protein [Trifolium medium]